MRDFSKKKMLMRGLLVATVETVASVLVSFGTKRTYGNENNDHVDRDDESCNPNLLFRLGLAITCCSYFVFDVLPFQPCFASYLRGQIRVMPGPGLQLLNTGSSAIKKKKNWI